LGGARGSVRLIDTGEDETRAVADLLGLAELPRGVHVRLDRLDRTLRESRFGTDLAAAMEVLGGPLRDRAGEREQERLRWVELWEAAAAHPAVAAWPDLHRWLAELRAGGLLR